MLFFSQVETLSRSGHIKNFSSLEDEHVHSPPIFGRSIKWRNSEERQLMKWVRIFQVGIFRAEFSRESLMGGNFPGGIFLEPIYWCKIEIEYVKCEKRSTENVKFSIAFKHNKMDFDQRILKNWRRESFATIFIYHTDSCQLTVCGESLQI